MTHLFKLEGFVQVIVITNRASVLLALVFLVAQPADCW